MSEEESRKPDPPKLSNPKDGKSDRPKPPKLKRPEPPKLQKPEAPKLNRPEPSNSEPPRLNRPEPSRLNRPEAKEPDSSKLTRPEPIKSKGLRLQKPDTESSENESSSDLIRPTTDQSEVPQRERPVMPGRENPEEATGSDEEIESGQRTFKPGENYGEYRVVRCLCTGLLANYYQMEHNQTHEDVTVGVFHKRTLEDNRFLRRLKALEKQMNAFDLEGIPKIRESALINQQHCTILDPVQGKCLSRFYRENVGPGEQGIDEEKTAEVLARLMGLLGYAHTKGIDHRDMDSDLILVDASGAIYILGLGIKAAMGRELFESIVSASVSPLESSQTVHRLNSFDMISPEYREGKEESPVVDIFAVGMIGYWLLTGRKASANDFEPPSKYLEELPKEWDEFLQKMLQRTGDQRYGSCKVALLALKSIYQIEDKQHEKVGLIQRQIDRLPVPKSIADRGEVATRIYRLSLIGIIGLTLTAIAAYALVEVFTEPNPYSKLVARVVEPGDEPDLQLSIQPPVAKVLFIESQNRFIINNGQANLKVQKGTYAIEVSAPNHISRRLTVEIDRGEIAYSRVILEPKWTDLMISSNPGVEVSVVNAEGDVSVLGVTNEAGLLDLQKGVFSGTYTLIFRKPGYETVKLESQVFSHTKATEIETELVPYPSTLTIQTEPEGASIFVDGKAIGTSPLRITNLNMDQEYLVKISLEGYREVVRPVTLEAGQALNLKLPPLELRVGALEFEIQVPAESLKTLEEIKEDLMVEIDGSIVAYGSESLSAVTEGKHSIRLLHPLYASDEREIVVEDGGTSLVEVALRQYPGEVIVEIPKTVQEATFYIKQEPVKVINNRIRVPSGTPIEVGVLAKDYIPLTRIFNLEPKEVINWELNLSPLPGPKLSEDWIVPYLNLAMAWVPAGSYTMGSPLREHGRISNEGPETEVVLTQGFWVGVNEVTQVEYIRILGQNPSEFVSKTHPVDSVTWEQAKAFCKKLTALEASAGRLPEGFIYRLPTEFEWEYFARAGTETPFHFGETASVANGNFKGVYPRDQLDELEASELYGTTDVRSYAPNGYGLYDLHGNVQEWTKDTYGARLPGGELTDPDARTSGSRIAVRGGSWQDSAVTARSASRKEISPDRDRSDTGFRVVLAPE